MIDLHSHILYGLDDGPATLDESLEMCRIGYRDGIRTIVATPHMLNGAYRNNRAAILSRTRELNAALSQSGFLESFPHHSAIRNPQFELQTLNSEPQTADSEIRTPNSELTILPGADVHLGVDLLGPLRQKRLMTVGNGGKYLLIEFPSQGIPYMAESILFRLIADGIIPIITHPERNPEVGRKPARYYEMIRMGCLGQVTAMSLTGGFGPEVKRLAEALLIHKLVHLIASDAHSIETRPPILTPAVRAASKRVGKEEAGRMVTEYPQAILEGRKPSLPQPISF
jgi:protein-tyrosine phosphatase